MYSLPCHHESTCHVVIRLCWRAPGLGVSWLFWLLGPCSREAEKQAKVLPGRLQMKRPRPQKSAPGGSKIEPRGGQNGLLEASGDLLGGSWAPDGRQDRSGSAPGRLLGRSWRLLGRSWRLFGPSWPCQEVPGRPREAPGKGSGRPFRCFLGWSSARR